MLGKETFGTAYKAILEMGTIVVVKRLKDVTNTEKELDLKIYRIAQITLSLKDDSYGVELSTNNSLYRTTSLN